MKLLPLALFSIFFTSPAYAIPIVEIIYDRLELGAMATYVAPSDTTNPDYLEPMNRPPGTVVTDNYVGSLFIPNRNSGERSVYTRSNIVEGHARANYGIGSSSFYMDIVTFLDDDWPNHISYPPIGTTAIVQGTWEAIFRVIGDGAQFMGVGLLYDLSLGSQVGHGGSLINNHEYSFSISSGASQSGYVGSAPDNDRGSSMSITNAYVRVPEPNSMLLFGTGLAGLAGLRRRKKA